MGPERTEGAGAPPLISLIIPVYNGAGVLPRCLEAVAASDYRSYECIVVDDSSTDQTAAIAAQFSVRVLTFGGGPCGPAHARNRGAAVARGSVLFFVDADVVLHPDALTKVAETFADHPEIGATFGSYDETPAEPGFISQYKNLSHHYVHHQGRSESATFWSGCGAVRRDAFLAVGGFDEKRYARPSIEDIELGYRLRAAGHPIRLNAAIQAKHLKRWTLTGMLKSDFYDRALPWTRLILRDRNLPDDLNLRFGQRLCALLACALLPYLVLAGAYTLVAGTVQPLLGAPLVLIPAQIVLLNRPFYAFFARKRGIGFAAGVLPLHYLYYLYSVLAFVVGTLLHLWEGRAARGEVAGASPRVAD
jgi:glycosyltransferase involved in cell wall biosynthesis